MDLEVRAVSRPTIPTTRGACAVLALCLGGCWQPVGIRLVADARPSEADAAWTPDAARADAGTADGGVLSPPDAGALDPPDLGLLDAGLPDRAKTDAGEDRPPDGGIARTEPDAGVEGDCARFGYCLERLDSSDSTPNLGATVRLSPVLSGRRETDFRFELRADALRAERRPGLPAPDLSELAFELRVTTDGEVSLRIDRVPPWFATTELVVRLWAVPIGGETELEPAVAGEGRVRLGGNVLLALPEWGAVHAVGLDGRPASGVGDQHPDGLLAAGSLTSPRGLCLLSDGGLAIRDATPNAGLVIFFGLDGPDRRLGNLPAFETSGVPLLEADDLTPGAIGQLDDGTIVALTTPRDPTRPSRVLAWEPSGRLRRRHSVAGARWRAMAAVGDRVWLAPEGGGPLERLDLGSLSIDAAPWPQTGVVDALLVSAGGGHGWWASGTALYQVLGPNLRPVTAVPTTRWVALAAWGDRLLAAPVDAQGVATPLIVDGAMGQGTLRLEPAVVGVPSALLTLE